MPHTLMRGIALAALISLGACQTMAAPPTATSPWIVGRTSRTTPSLRTLTTGSATAAAGTLRWGAGGGGRSRVVLGFVR